MVSRAIRAQCLPGSLLPVLQLALVVLKNSRLCLVTSAFAAMYDTTASEMSLIFIGNRVSAARSCSMWRSMTCLLAAAMKYLALSCAVSAELDNRVCVRRTA